jgi:hypothetical protein
MGFTAKAESDPVKGWWTPEERLPRTRSSARLRREVWRQGVRKPSLKPRASNRPGNISEISKPGTRFVRAKTAVGICSYLTNIGYMVKTYQRVGGDAHDQKHHDAIAWFLADTVGAIQQQRGRGAPGHEPERKLRARTQAGEIRRRDHGTEQ